MRGRAILANTTAALALAALAAPSGHAAAPPVEVVVANYAAIAAAAYEDAWLTAKDLQAGVAALLAEPAAPTQQAAKVAWLAARVPYQQTEAYRFGNALVDDWEGKVNAWPLERG
jgi:putative iron-regulated protein